MAAAEQPSQGQGGQGARSRWLRLYEPHEKPIAFALNVVTAFGTIVSAIALILTYGQIRQAQETLTATTEYQISKDSAELWDTIPDDTWRELGTSGSLSVQAERQIIRVFSFVAAVQEQRKLVGTEFWNEFAGGFCGFLSNPAVSKLWQAKVATRKLAFNDSFVALGEKCGKRNS